MLRVPLKLKWPDETLARELKGHARKVKIAARLRTETTMTMQWIANRLNMGTVTYARDQLYRHRAKRR